MRFFVWTTDRGGGYDDVKYDSELCWGSEKDIKDSYADQSIENLCDECDLVLESGEDCKKCPVLEKMDVEKCLESLTDVVDGGYPGTWVEVLGFPEPTKDEMEGH